MRTTASILSLAWIMDGESHNVDPVLKEAYRLKALGWFAKARALLQSRVALEHCTLEEVFVCAETFFFQGLYTQCAALISTRFTSESVVTTGRDEDSWNLPLKLLQCCVTAITTANIQTQFRIATKLIGTPKLVSSEQTPAHEEARITRLMPWPIFC